MSIMEVMERDERKRPRVRRSFTAAFKAEIVELCQRGDRSIGQVARDFDLTETAVREWVRQAERDAGTRGDGGLTSIPATFDTDRALDEPPLILGRVDRVHGIPRRRGRPVEPLQGVGDRRPVQFERGDYRGELGADVGWHQVGQVARLGHEITLRKERPADERVSPVADAGLDGRLKWRVSWIGRLAWLAARSLGRWSHRECAGGRTRPPTTKEHQRRWRRALRTRRRHPTANPGASGRTVGEHGQRDDPASYRQPCMRTKAPSHDWRKPH
jgi:transposase-like protein